MRIFIVHNHYQHPGGEDMVFMQEASQLKKLYEVETMVFKNKTGIMGALQFMLYPWNVFAAKRIRRKITDFRPDIVHVHNIHYAVGPLLFRMLSRLKIPIVFTLHNYRILDPSATLFHKDKVFTDTIKANFPWKSVWRRVLDDSAIKSFWVALTYYLHKKLRTWGRVDRYLVLSGFAQNIILESSLGLDAEQMAIKPNFVVPPSLLPTAERKGHFVYIGRLSIEKGIGSLLRAFAQSTYHIKIFGDGPLRQQVEEYAQGYPNITYMGYQDKDALYRHLLESQALVVPSICFEGMPISVLEAFASGTPVLASNIGILKEMIPDNINGLHFEPNNENSMVDTLDKWMNLSIAAKKEISDNCKKDYLENYSPQKNVLLLTGIYKQVIAQHKT